MTRRDLEALELRLLLDGIHAHHGYDFRGYSRSSLRRRVWRRVTEEQLETISGLLELVLHDDAAMDRLLVDLSINVTSMFRDPTFYVAMRETVVPLLKTYPYIRIWNAGCSTGEETYSLAILLHEEGLADRARIYATDINEGVLRQAKDGFFPLDRMRDFTRDYIKAGGKAAFSDYYKVYGERARFDPALIEPVVFAQHNLVSDGRFNEFHLVVCRNVLIYFDRDLQNRVHSLFYDSLIRFGMLALGHKESIRFTSHAEHYAELDSDEKLYRRVA
jgi:chemotaxis protein methyltransferase CheR